MKVSSFGVIEVVRYMLSRRRLWRLEQRSIKRVLPPDAGKGKLISSITMYAFRNRLKRRKNILLFTCQGSRGDIRFSSCGDSGAFAMDRGCRVLGMVLGRTEGMPNVLEGYENWGMLFTSYITPMSLVREIVEKLIGPFDVVFAV